MTLLQHEQGTVEHGLLTPSSNVAPSSIAPGAAPGGRTWEARTRSCGPAVPSTLPRLFSLLDGAFCQSPGSWVQWRAFSPASWGHLSPGSWGHPAGGRPCFRQGHGASSRQGHGATQPDVS